MIMEKILNDEKTSILVKFNKQMSHILENIEKSREELSSNSVDLNKSYTDIQSNFHNIIKKMDNGPFHEILNKYNGLLGSIENTLKNLSLQTVDIFKAFENTEAIQPLKRQLGHIIAVSHSYIPLVTSKSEETALLGVFKAQTDPLNVQPKALFENYRRGSVPNGALSPLGELTLNTKQYTVSHKKKQSDPNCIKIVDYQPYRVSQSQEGNVFDNLKYKTCQLKDLNVDKENWTTEQTSPFSKPLTYKDAETPKNNLDSSLRRAMKDCISPRSLNAPLKSKDQNIASPNLQDDSAMHKTPNTKSQKDIFYLYVENKLQNSRMNEKSSERLRHVLLSDSPKGWSRPKDSSESKTPKIMAINSSLPLESTEA